MKIGRETELKCPRCRLVATRPPGRQTHCSHCGAELVETRVRAEDWIRSYLFAGERDLMRVGPVPSIDSSQVGMTR